MRIGIVDADLISKKKHRFPNLASMKISGYHKAKGDEVTLITSYPSYEFSNNHIQRIKQKYDRIYVSKVFVDSAVPTGLLNLDITTYGGSGFFYSDAEPLPPYIENHMPDYHLYDEWVQQKISEGVPEKEFKYYQHYSIGFTTRGCVRQCKFCINKHCTKVEKASNINDFLDKDRRWICLLDDNILAYENWKEILNELNATGKQFEFNQGLDIRSMNEEKARVLSESNLYMNNIYFAFDNINEKPIIEEKLKLWRTYYKKHTHMYVLCGYDENGKYDEEFWGRDIISTLERIKVCMKYNVFPYIMRYQKYKTAPSPYYGMYVNLASWCNQKGTIMKYSLSEWGNAMQRSDEKLHNKKRLYSVKKYLMEYAGKYPEIAYEYYDVHYDDISEYKYERNSSIRKADCVNQIVNNNSSNVISIDSIKDKLLLNIKKIKEMALEFHNSTIKLYRKTVEQIPLYSTDLLLVNCKKDTLDTVEKSILKFSQFCLKKNGNLIVYNNDEESFSETKEFIEKHSDLRLIENVQFRGWNNKGRKIIRYCSRFSNVNQTKLIFNNEIVKNKEILFKYLINELTKEKDVIMSFFELLKIMKNINEDDYNNRFWLCFKRASIDCSESAINTINEIVTLKQQISLQSIEKNDVVS